MGWLSSWFGGSAPTSASETQAAEARRSFSGSAEDTWRKLYAPGTNPKMNSKTTGGGAYYDNVKDATEPTTWEYILRSENMRNKSFGDIANEHGYIGEKELAAVLNNPKIDTAKLMKEADADRDGRLSRKEFSAVLDTYFKANK